ncbi:MAG: D-alanine--D-alanine ligase [Candidatus Abyssobacteria bacterium SURF_5]|uniref:D-alanine--D-alanine ligase n=1 Tax=Abyssobacteria bacterium (strain SURF_5) TaxID=2093360 RepID=A0A3A4NY96_ABYX5|nr:MAG: D-alanine--D-alanine ligase [Candidatus Abyssubacteria bacterium SURF_5]
MRMGLTYDLRQEYLEKGYGEEETAEFDRLDTIEALERALAELGHETERIGNIESLTRRLAAGGRWDMVFNIAEGMRGFGREAQVPALLDAYDIPYVFSDPLVLSLTLHKGMTKHVVRDLGIPTADFAVVESEEDIEGITLPFPLFAKPVAEGTGKGISAASKIVDRDQLRRVCLSIARQFRQPVLVETYLPGRELTVGITGTGKAATAVGVVEVVLREGSEADAYSYSNKQEWERFVEYPLVTGRIAEESAEIALAAWRGLGCRDGGRIDIRMDSKGIPNFMEVNPLAGLNPDHSDLCFIAYRVGMTYRDLIAQILTSAIKRYSVEQVAHEGRYPIQ